ncbi:DsbA family protein [Desulfoluna limicola]|uniref:DsbA family protein n=1 Tax=Desulfoluna limicola TaxID=2810562 RepID=A0ABN6F2W3_9BACT|nr:DsbA family protein [Desulfoluna limicola]BCS95647.1 DsbA family protein [Desulfoluna limicola]
MSPNTTKEIIYVGDPMCAWCFGFAPVLDALIKRFEPSVPFRFIMGGLRVDDPIAITDKIKPRLLENWEGVTRATGQAINGHLLADAPEFLYDSGPASRAFVAVRSLDETLALPYYRALHHAFYLDMKDISQPETLCNLAERVGVSRTEFSECFAFAGIDKETKADFELAAAYNAQAFPALVLKEGGTASVLNQGYKPLSALSGLIDEWVTGTLLTSEVTPALLIFGRP